MKVFRTTYYDVLPLAEVNPRDPRILRFLVGELSNEEKEQLFSQLGEEWAEEGEALTQEEVKRVLSCFFVEEIRDVPDGAQLRFAEVWDGLCRVRVILPSE